MKFKNKKTKLFLVLGASTLALGSIGFASWVIGVQQKEASGNLNVQVDNASLSNIQIIQKLQTNKVTIAESGTTGNDTDIIKATANSEGAITLDQNAFKFNFETLQIKVGKGVSEDVRPTKLIVELSTEAEHNKKNTVDPKNNLIEIENKDDQKPNEITGKKFRTESDLKYLDFQTKEFLLDYNKVTAENDYYTFDFASEAKNLSFKLGSYFKTATDTSICKFYNDIYSTTDYPRDTHFDFLTKQAENIYKELTAMKTALEETNALTLKIRTDK